MSIVVWRRGGNRECAHCKLVRELEWCWLQGIMTLSQHMHLWVNDFWANERNMDEKMPTIKCLQSEGTRSTFLFVYLNLRQKGKKNTWWNMVKERKTGISKNRYIIYHGKNGQTDPSSTGPEAHNKSLRALFKTKSSTIPYVLHMSGTIW